MTESYRETAEFLRSLPATLSTFRNERWITQQEVAQAIGCHQNTLGYFERAERSISLKLTISILDWMDDVQQKELADGH